MPKERADAIVKLIESQIQTNKILVPSPPIEDSPQINIMNICMTSPPVYVADDKVGKNVDYLITSYKSSWVFFFLNTQESSFTN
jgi:transketolase